jgi:threonine aldolase
MGKIDIRADLRSDTVTKPTFPMREVMAAAPVGDDVIDIDPTTRQLEERTAELLGKEAALFMPSGSMTNQIGIRVHCEPGDEFLCDYHAHVYVNEQGAFAQLSQLVAHTIHGDDGILDVEQLKPCVRAGNDHQVRTRLVCLENTHNRGSGRIFPLEKIRAISDWARSIGLKMHLDGARLWNAVAATKISERDWAAGFDSISVCFSKGLGAPVGSCLAGDQAFIKRARRARKLFGGGMRQSGILASAALYALDHHRDRLVDDHRRAKQLAESIQRCEGLSLVPKSIDTNIVIFRVDPQLGTASEFLEKLRQHGVDAMATSATNIRFVTHLDVGQADIDYACEILQALTVGFAA